MFYDHFLIVFNVITQVHTPSDHHAQPQLIYSKANYDTMCSFLLKFDFSGVYRSSDVETIWLLLRNAITTAIQMFTPLCTPSKSHHPKWFTKDIRHKHNCQRTLRRRCKFKLTPTLIQRLSPLEASIHHEIAHSKVCFETDIVNNHLQSNSSKIFSYINLSQSKIFYHQSCICTQLVPALMRTRPSYSISSFQCISISASNQFFS